MKDKISLETDYAETVCIQLCQQVDAADPQGIFRKCQASPGKCFPDQLLGTQILSAFGI